MSATFYKNMFPNMRFGHSAPAPHGRRKKYSDLDLAVITDKTLSLSVSAELAEAFSESDLPWKVDVVDWVTTSDSFRKIIEKDKVVLQRGGNRQS